MNFKNSVVSVVWITKVRGLNSGNNYVATDEIYIPHFFTTPRAHNFWCDSHVLDLGAQHTIDLWHDLDNSGFNIYATIFFIIFSLFVLGTVFTHYRFPDTERLNKFCNTVISLSIEVKVMVVKTYRILDKYR